MVNDRNSQWYFQFFLVLFQVIFSGTYPPNLTNLDSTVESSGFYPYRYIKPPMKYLRRSWIKVVAVVVVMTMWHTVMLCGLSVMI